MPYSQSIWRRSTSTLGSIYASEGPRLLEPELLALDEEMWPTKRSSVHSTPRGVVAVIKPWNYPIELAAWAIAPALLAGNTVVFKPSEHSPLAAVELCRILTEAGLPGGPQPRHRSFVRSVLPDYFTFRSVGAFVWYLMLRNAFEHWGAMRVEMDDHYRNWRIPG